MMTTGRRAIHLCRGHNGTVGACEYAISSQAKVTTAISEYTARKPRSPNWSRKEPRSDVLDSTIWLPQNASAATTSERRPWLIVPVLYPPDRRAISELIFSKSCRGSPATRTTLSRPVEPTMIEKSRRDKCHMRASKRSRASLARPASAGAVTVALSMAPLPDATTPNSRSLRDRGESRIATRRPSRATVTGLSDKVFEHQVAQEPEKQDENYRRDVDPAEIRDHPPD